MRRKRRIDRRRYPRHTIRKMYDRNYDDPIYVKWRDDVKERDSFRCQWPSCRCRNKQKLQVHHIKKWSDYPHLRFILNNGITLCKYHHKMVWGKEEVFEAFMMKLLEIQLLKKLKGLEEA